MDQSTRLGILAFGIIGLLGAGAAAVVFWPREERPAVTSRSDDPRTAAENSPSPFRPQPDSMPTPIEAPTPVRPIVAEKSADDVGGLLAHPWWKGRVVKANVEGILGVMQSRGNAVIFFDRQGAFVATSGDAMVRPRTAQLNEMTGAYANAEGKYPAVKSLGRHKKLTLTPGRLGVRLTRREAIAILADSLHLPSLAEIEDFGEEQFKQLEKMQFPGQ